MMEVEMEFIIKYSLFRKLIRHFEHCFLVTHQIITHRYRLYFQ